MIVLVDSALEVMALAMHRQEDLVQVPLVGPDKASNWLPAPAGPCVLMLRVYWPHEQRPSMLHGSWTIPAVKKVSGPAERGRAGCDDLHGPADVRGSPPAATQVTSKAISGKTGKASTERAIL
jgi:hypothetical protein